MVARPPLRLRIEPMPRETRKNIYTEHRTVELREPRMPDSEPSSTPSEPVIEIGDRVMVLYNDSPGQQAVLRTERHSGCVHVCNPVWLRKPFPVMLYPKIDMANGNYAGRQKAAENDGDT